MPAETGVILKAEEGDYGFIHSASENVVNVEGNLLEGSVVITYVEGDAYVLANGINGVGLYKALLNKNDQGNAGTTHFLNNANKAYLKLSEETGAAMFSLDRGEGTTGIQNSELNAQDATVIYDLQGRRVDKMEKGIYIVNGKKVVK